jgi:hypothetical protein
MGFYVGRCSANIGRCVVIRYMCLYKGSSKGGKNNDLKWMMKAAPFMEKLVYVEQGWYLLKIIGYLIASYMLSVTLINAFYSFAITAA